MLTIKCQINVAGGIYFFVILQNETKKWRKLISHLKKSIRNAKAKILFN